VKVRIWDAPTRLFHWLLVILVSLLWWSAEEEKLDLHLALGLVVLGLLVFRLLWGLFGSSTARFTNFVRGPRAVLDYLSGRARFVLGHNPLGALSVVALLGLLAALVGLGLFASDEDGLYSGPLAHLVDPDLSEEATELHEDGFDVLLVLVALHIAAIVYYRIFRRDDLVTPLVTGVREAPEGTAPMIAAPWWRLALAVGVAAGLAWWIGAAG
jgi:cytochrome b